MKAARILKQLVAFATVMEALPLAASLDFSDFFNGGNLAGSFGNMFPIGGTGQNGAWSSMSNINGKISSNTGTINNGQVASQTTTDPPSMGVADTGWGRPSMFSGGSIDQNGAWSSTSNSNAKVTTNMGTNNNGLITSQTTTNAPMRGRGLHGDFTNTNDTVAADTKTNIEGHVAPEAAMPCRDARSCGCWW